MALLPSVPMVAPLFCHWWLFYLATDWWLFYFATGGSFNLLRRPLLSLYNFLLLTHKNWGIQQIIKRLLPKAKVKIFANRMQYCQKFDLWWLFCFVQEGTPPHHSKISSMQSSNCTEAKFANLQILQILFNVQKLVQQKLPYL